jgi:hypothetical protein
MRGQKGICLFCRHALKLRPSIPFTKRLASSRSNEPFILPRLVIDLDAADSKLVRRWEDIVLEENPAPPKEPTVRGYRQSMEKKKKDGKFKLLPISPLKTLITMPPDLLNYALLGDPTATRSIRYPQARKLFQSRMIQPEDSAETKLQQLTFNFLIDETERFAASGFPESSELAIVDQITEIKVFSKLHRTIAMLSRTVEGCQFLARNSIAILESIRKCRKAQKDVRPSSRSSEMFNAKMVLRLLNNLQLNMESKGVDFGPRLSNAGLYYAGKLQRLPALRKYLQILCANSYATDWRTVAALRFVFRTSMYEISVVKRDDMKSEFLRLLTGWEKDGIRQDGEKRSLSFASLCHQDSSTEFLTCIYPKYLLALGEVKCTEALWAEWKSAEANAEYMPFPSFFRGAEHMRFRARMFAFAFLVGGDKLRALEVLRWVPTDHEDKFTKGYQGLISTWTYVDAPNLSSGEWLLALIHDHYLFNNVWPNTDLLNEMKEAIAYLPKGPLEALNELNRFVLEGLDANDKERRHVGWEKNTSGQAGLAIRLEEAGPVYWRPEELFSEPELKDPE